MYDPLSVRSVAFCLLLAAALKTTLLRHGFYFRATVVFRCVLRTSQKNYSCTAGISACSSGFSKSQILCICSLYLLSIHLYSCLFYHVNIVVVICQEQSSAPWLRWCLHALLFRSPYIYMITLYFINHPVDYPVVFLFGKIKAKVQV